MDFDAYLDKKYVRNVLKFMIDNSEKRIYYGNPYMKKENNVVFMGGNFYAFTQTLLNDYCTCKIPNIDMDYEDEWFGNVLSACTKSLDGGQKKEIKFMYNDMSKILHREYKGKGVELKLGRLVYDKEDFLPQYEEMLRKVASMSAASALKPTPN
ncbi:hypothetical protein AYI70_g8942 [Smittium culicis]|uniref:Hexosyltransferase n=1 Tax=Smittium culicis TaxID=133412 RepID=A0A1R1XDL5_9FUNG|nr:hypothetical protein AYI70_g8942 [Smittium culicis]